MFEALNAGSRRKPSGTFTCLSRSPRRSMRSGEVSAKKPHGAGTCANRKWSTAPGMLRRRRRNVKWRKWAGTIPARAAAQEVQKVPREMIRPDSRRLGGESQGGIQRCRGDENDRPNRHDNRWTSGTGWPPERIRSLPVLS